jgi:membrane protease YdiL (CAAX protease family)
MDVLSGTMLPAPTRPIAVCAPSVWAATGMIALYFVWQGLASVLFVALVGLAGGAISIQAGAGQLDGGIRTVLAQPGMQALTVMVSLGTAGALTVWLAHGKWPQSWSQARAPGFGFTRPRSRWFFALAIVAGLAMPLLGSLLTHWLAHGHALTQDIQQLGRDTPPALRVLLALVVISVGPLVEELLFRGVLLSALQRWHVGWAVSISSMAFGLAHLPGLQFQWYALPDLVLLGCVLAWLRLRSGSIWPAILAHGTNNLLAVLAWFVAINLPG